MPAAVTAYLNAQIEAGAQAVMIFDYLGRCAVAPRLQGVLAGLPATHRCRPEARARRRSASRASCSPRAAASGWKIIAAIGCDAVGLDWTTDIGAARRRVGDKVALQGNLDPVALFAQPEKIAQEARAILDAFGPAAAMSSISATAFPSSRRRNTSRRW
jgi:uroporphyrinogen decarboxylase